MASAATKTKEPLPIDDLEDIPDPRRSDPRLQKPYVVLHGGVGAHPRGTVVTPYTIYANTVYVDPLRYRRVKRADPNAPDSQHLRQATRFLEIKEILDQFQRLIALKAVREATAFEATQTFVHLQDEQSTALASEEVIAGLKAEIERLRAENAKMENLGELARMRDAIRDNTLNGLTALNNPELLAAKERQINETNARLAALQPSPESFGLTPNVVDPPNVSSPVGDPGEVSSTLPPPPAVENQLHRPGSGKGEAVRKGKGGD